jgi:hypothetical protein
VTRELSEKLKSGAVLSGMGNDKEHLLVSEVLIAALYSLFTLCSRATTLT